MTDTESKSAFPMFSKRHYLAIGEVIRSSPIWTGGDPIATEHSVQQMAYLIERFADMFAADNPRFLRDAFYRQTGMPKLKPVEHHPMWATTKEVVGNGKDKHTE